MIDEDLQTFLENRGGELCQLEYHCGQMLDIIENMQNLEILDFKKNYPVQKLVITGLMQFFGEEFGKYAQELEEMLL
jgi:hypothetical protein